MCPLANQNTKREWNWGHSSTTYCPMIIYSSWVRRQVFLWVTEAWQVVELALDECNAWTENIMRCGADAVVGWWLTTSLFTPCSFFSLPPPPSFHMLWALSDSCWGGGGHLITHFNEGNEDHVLVRTVLTNELTNYKTTKRKQRRTEKGTWPERKLQSCHDKKV